MRDDCGRKWASEWRELCIERKQCEVKRRAVEWVSACTIPMSIFQLWFVFNENIFSGVFSTSNVNTLGHRHKCEQIFIFQSPRPWLTLYIVDNYIRTALMYSYLLWDCCANFVPFRLVNYAFTVQNIFFFLTHSIFIHWPHCYLLVSSNTGFILSLIWLSFNENFLDKERKRGDRYAVYKYLRFIICEWV